MADNLLLQQQKLAGIQQQQQQAQQVVPGQVVGETPQQFAQAKQNYNIFKSNQPQPVQQPAQKPAEQAQPAVKPAEKAPVITNTRIDPTSPTSGMDAVIASMYTSPEQEERMRRASLANQRILAIGDALRHIGNIYHTVNYSPSQQFNSPVTEEYERYQKGKAVRDAANMRYLNYQQAKAAQDAKQRELDRQYEATERYRKAQLENRKQELDRLDKQYELNERKAVWQQQYQQGTLDIKKEQQKLNEEYKRGMLSVAQYRAATYALNANGGGRGGGGGRDFTTEITYEPNTYDNNGKMVQRGKQTTKRTYGNNGGGQGKFSGFSIHK